MCVLGGDIKYVFFLGSLNTLDPIALECHVIPTAYKKASFQSLPQALQALQLFHGDLSLLLSSVVSQRAASSSD